MLQDASIPSHMTKLHYEPDGIEELHIKNGKGHKFGGNVTTNGKSSPTADQRLSGIQITQQFLSIAGFF
jgi:hypothetical protein